MASKSIKIRAKLKNGTTTIKALITHPMESGRRKNKETKELIPAEFIQEVACVYKGETLLNVDCGAGLSMDPYVSFDFEGGAKGDQVKLSWVDNLGNSDSAETKIR